MSIGKVDIENLFDFELATYPTSLCNETGLPRYTKNKSDLKNLLKVTVSNRKTKFDCMIIDGNAMLYSTIYWPKGSEVNKLVESVSVFIFSNLKKSDVYLIFDRYHEYSIKSETRKERQGAFMEEHT